MPAQASARAPTVPNLPRLTLASAPTRRRRRPPRRNLGGDHAVGRVERQLAVGVGLRADVGGAGGVEGVVTLAQVDGALRVNQGGGGLEVAGGRQGAVLEGDVALAAEVRLAQRDAALALRQPAQLVEAAALLPGGDGLVEAAGLAPRGQLREEAVQLGVGLGGEQVAGVPADAAGVVPGLGDVAALAEVAGVAAINHAPTGLGGGVHGRVALGGNVVAGRGRERAGRSPGGSWSRTFGCSRFRKGVLLSVSLSGQPVRSCGQSATPGAFSPPWRAAARRRARAGAYRRRNHHRTKVPSAEATMARMSPAPGMSQDALWMPGSSTARSGLEGWW